MKKNTSSRVATLLGVSLASIAIVACSGGGGGSFGMSDGGTRTAESSCDVVIKWLNSCKLSIDRATCVKEASSYSANQLAASEACVNRNDCDKAAFQKCMEQVVASEPAASPTKSSNPNTTANDAGVRGSTTPPETDPSPGTGTGSDTARKSCMTSKCATQTQGCQASTECKSLANCLAQAGTDPQQKDQCETDFGGGVSPYNAVLQCAQKSCATECTY